MTPRLNKLHGRPPLPYQSALKQAWRNYRLICAEQAGYGPSPDLSAAWDLYQQAVIRQYQAAYKKGLIPKGQIWYV